MANQKTSIPIVFAGDLLLNGRPITDLTYKQEPSGAYVQVARLPAAGAFAISGNFNTAGLAPGPYKAAFVIRIEGDHPPNKPMNVTLTLDGQNPIITDLNNLDRDNWIKIEYPFNNIKPGNLVFRMAIGDNDARNEPVFVNGIVVKPAGPAPGNG